MQRNNTQSMNSTAAITVSFITPRSPRKPPILKNKHLSMLLKRPSTPSEEKENLSSPSSTTSTPTRIASPYSAEFEPKDELDFIPPPHVLFSNNFSLSYEPTRNRCAINLSIWTRPKLSELSPQAKSVVSLNSPNSNNK